MMKILSGLRYICYLIGILVLVSVLVEFIPSIPRKVRLAYLEANGIARHQNVKNSAYGDAPWLNDYWFEQTTNIKARWAPYVYWRMREMSSDTVNIDALGRRKTVQNVIANETNLLVYMFGGSTLWGWGVPDQHTIPSEVASLLNQKNIKIVNYGEQGYVNTQSYLQLLLALRRGERPDVVIFYDGFNDLLVPTFHYDAGLPHNETKRIAEFKLSLNEERWRTYQLAFKFAYGRTLKYARRIREWLSPPDSTSMSENEKWASAEEVIRIYEFNKNLVNDLARRYNFRSVFFLQPILGVDPNNLPEPGQKATIFEAGYRIAHDRFASHSDLIFLDGALEADSRYYLDDVHITHEGNRIIAREIYNILERRKFLDIRVGQ